MPVKKDISKTIRLDQTVIDYIMTFDGKTFSECFNNMIYLFRDRETDIKSKLQMQQRKVDRLQDKIDSVETKLHKLDMTTYDLMSLDQYVKRIRADLELILDDS